MWVDGLLSVEGMQAFMRVWSEQCDDFDRETERRGVIHFLSEEERLSVKWTPNPAPNSEGS